MLKKCHEAPSRISSYVKKSFKDGVLFPMFTDVNFGSALTFATALSTASYYLFGPEACSVFTPLFLISAGLIGIYRQQHRFDNGRSRVLYDPHTDPNSTAYKGQTEGMEIAKQAVQEGKEDVQIIKNEVRERIDETERYLKKIIKDPSLLPTSSQTTT